MWAELASICGQNRLDCTVLSLCVWAEPARLYCVVCVCGQNRLDCTVLSLYVWAELARLYCVVSVCVGRTG